MVVRSEYISLLAALGVASVTWWWLKRKRESVDTPTPKVEKEEKIILSPNPQHEIGIYFGSQTGTAESFARELAEEAVSDFGLTITNSSGSAESVDAIKECGKFFEPRKDGEDNINLVLLLSTYGEGDPSDDAVAFDEFLLNTEMNLKHVNYAIFGLGNKQYALFNAMAKRVDKNLQRLGATRVCPTGLGDDNEDIEGDFQFWKNEKFWPLFLKECFGLDVTAARENRVARDPRDKCLLELKIGAKRSQLPFDATVHSSGGDVLSKAFFSANIVPIVSVVHLCEGKTQIDVDISKVPSLRYRTGDTLEVLPINRTEDVEWLMGVYEFVGESFMSFTKKKSVSKLTVKKPFPTPCTVFQALSRYVDLRGRPSRSMIRDIALMMGQSIEEAELLAESLRRRKCVYTVRNILEGPLKGFHEMVSLGDLIQILPKQKMRAYSICSSPLVDPKRISLVVSRVDDDALASVLLSDIVQTNDTLLVNLRQGTFRLPALPSQPVVMICAGTGFAPFRAFIAELKMKNRIAKDKTLLFFGCRRKSEWIYRKEMEEFENLGGSLFVALSREDPNEYVQNKLSINIDLVGDLVNKRNAVVYVCGSTAMGLAVMDVLSKVTSIEDLRTEKRYVEELWG